MKAQKISQSLKTNFAKLNNFSKKFQSPRAYSAYAAIGVVVTTVLAIACTRKQCEYENEKNSQLEKSENKSEEIVDIIAKGTIKQTVINYAPVIASAATTILFIRKSDQKWMEYNKLINAAYLASRDKMARYRMLAPAAVGAELVQGLNGQKSEPGVEWYCIKDCPVDIGETKDIYFQSTKADVIEAEYCLNRNFQLRGSASVREFFAFLGILDKFPEIYGDALGWDVGIMMEEWEVEPWVDFEHWHTTDQSTGEVINMISFTWEPGFTEDYSALAWGYGEGCGIPYTGDFLPGPRE